MDKIFLKEEIAEALAELETVTSPSRADELLTVIETNQIMLGVKNGLSC